MADLDGRIEGRMSAASIVWQRYPVTAGSDLYISGVSKPMSQMLSGYFPPQLKQKSTYQHGS
jgi:hypothetical protein